MAHKPAMVSVVEKITPALAAVWLGKNANNRSIRRSVVTRLAGEMSSGLWRVTHEGIAFDTAGNLRDGQHRLLAIIEAGVTLSMLVTRNVDPDTCHVLNTGVTRTVSDLVCASWCDSHLVTIFRSAMMGCGGTYALVRAKMSRQGQAVGVLANRLALESIKQWEGGKHVVFTGPSLGPVLRAYYHEDRDRLAAFVAELRQPATIDPKSPVILLRELILKTRGTTGGGSHAAIIYGKTTRALVGYLAGERFSKLFAADDAHWPAPPTGTDDA